jgi:hypothetical protein
MGKGAPGRGPAKAGLGLAMGPSKGSAPREGAGGADQVSVRLSWGRIAHASTAYETYQRREGSRCSRPTEKFLGRDSVTAGANEKSAAVSRRRTFEAVRARFIGLIYRSFAEARRISRTTCSGSARDIGDKRPVRQTP